MGYWVYAIDSDELLVCKFPFSYMWTAAIQLCFGRCSIQEEVMFSLVDINVRAVFRCGILMGQNITTDN